MKRWKRVGQNQNKFLLWMVDVSGSKKKKKKEKKKFDFLQWIWSFRWEGDVCNACVDSSGHCPCSYPIIWFWAIVKKQNKNVWKSGYSRTSSNGTVYVYATGSVVSCLTVARSRRTEGTDRVQGALLTTDTSLIRPRIIQFLSKCGKFGDQTVGFL